MCSGRDVARNVRDATALIREAASGGASYVQTPEVTTVVSRMGRAEVGSDPMGTNQSDVFVMLKPRDQWRRGVDKDSLEREITERLEDRVPGIAISMTQPMQMRLH